MGDNSYSKLIEESIKLHFERNGTLDEMRSGLHVEVLKMLHGKKKLRKDEALCGGELEQRGLSHLLNQLIVDYFDWFGYKHTLETFSLETGIKSNKSREKLRRELNFNFERKELPILLEMLMKNTNKQPKMEESQSDQAMLEINPTQLEKKHSPSLVVKELQKVEIKSPALTLRGNMSKELGSPIKLNSFTKPITPFKYVKSNPAKVNIRERMVEVDNKVSSKSKKVEKKSIENEKIVKDPYYTDASSESTKSSTEDNKSESSETFADIPNRYYYREQEPPEKTYPQGYGEEGPYEGPQPKKSDKPSNSPKVEKSKTNKIYEVDNKHKKSRRSSKDIPKAANTKPKVTDQSTSKRSKFVYQSSRFNQYRVNQSEDDLDMSVSKPKCPETVISSIKLDSADDTDEDSDVYL